MNFLKYKYDHVTFFCKTPKWIVIAYSSTNLRPAWWQLKEHSHKSLQPHFPLWPFWHQALWWVHTHFCVCIFMFILFLEISFKTCFGISHQPSQSWAWSSFSKLPSTLPHSKIPTCIAMNCLHFHSLLELSYFSILHVLYTIWHLVKCFLQW